MKRILSMLCVLAIMLGMITVPAFAAAEGAVQQDVTVLSANAENLTVESDTYIDLNGHSIAGVTVADGATLYVSDSQTDDYDVADGIYGAVTGISGAVAAAEGYIAITEEGAVSYHKVDLTLTSMTLRPAVAGVYYNSAFAADEVVARNVVSYGVALSVAAEPTAENLDTLCGYSTITGFEEGEKSGTLLTGVMNESNTDYANDRNAAMAIYGRAYIKTAEGYTFGACASRDLKTQVEAIDTVFASLKEAQSAAILAMYAAYESVMANWDVPNIKHAAVTGDTVITVPVSVEDGEVTETVTVEQDGVSITIPFGTLVEADELTLTVTRKSQSDSGIEAEEGQTLMPFDVHVEGLSSENEAPLTIALGKVMPENLNLGNYSIYHVEADGTKEMELVDSAEALTGHNQFAYTLDGELTLNMASFSEAVAVINDANAWNNGVDHSWYDAEAKNLYIRNADQLWSLSQIVGGMAEGIDQDGFAGKTITLLADISIGDTVSGNSKVFYPIGYWNNQKTYAELAGIEGVSSGFYAFQGTFDGNGNTISDFYQNTWEMEGDYNDGYSANSNYFRDGMGLFGKVYGGTVKNLTVKNFQCDSEHGTTGAIAAYADCGATFENIAIFDCNPRVYNIGNGGIVGAVGWYAKDEVNNKVTFENITVDSSNKISALWGTYDAACGGLVGQYYPTSGQDSTISNSIHFENCHVAAEMDVNNDVCGNYQYYWYRYCGMFIGSTRTNKTENGYTVANADSVTANNCTYNIGKWNNYYYCELVANSQASYTHDHQMSRLVPVASVEGTTVTPLEGEAFTVPATGRYNYVVVSGEHATENATCYHFVDGAVWNHADSGEETVNGATVLKEDKQHIYLPFNQLMTGYGWGVKAYQEFDGIEADLSQLAQSSEKFTAKLEQGAVISADTTSIPVSQLFAAKDGANINESTVHVFISPVGENSTVVPTYVCVTNNELDDIAALPISGAGAAKITITDYYFCLPTTINVFVEGFGRVTSVDQITAGGEFVIVANVNGDYLALGTSTNDSDRIDPISVEIDAVSKTVTTKDAPVWTIIPVSGGVAFQAGDKYLQYKTTTEFKLADTYSKLIVGSGADGFTFTYNNPNDRGIMYRKGTQNVFGSYAISQASDSNKNEYFRFFEVYKKMTAPAVCSHELTITIPEVPATCTTTGTTAIERCECGQNSTGGEVIAATGHTEVTVTGKAATCTETGLTDGTKCSVCKAVLVAQETIPALGHAFSEGVCTVCGEEDPDYVTDPDETEPTEPDPTDDYVLTDLADIGASDIVVITMTYTNGTTYALSNNNGTSSAPTATIITIDGDKINGEVADTIKWNISKDSNNYIFYPNGTTDSWLYCTATNNGVRVGTNANKVFTVDASSGYLKNTATSRYLGVYRDNPDWRCYTNTTGNTANQTLGFYVKKGISCNHVWSDWVITKAASCEEAGEKARECSTCGTKETLTISANGHNYVDGVCSACGVNAPAELTLSFADKANRTSISTTQQVWKQNGITFTNNKDSSTNDVADYANPVRLYKDSTVTIDATGMTKIVFTCSSSSYATALKNSIGTVSGVTVTASGSTVTIEFTEAVDSFTINLTSGQVRIASLTVSTQ